MWPGASAGRALELFVVSGVGLIHVRGVCIEFHYVPPRALVSSAVLNKYTYRYPES